MEKSKIEWTDATLNFWYGCAKISEGCKNCYAADLVKVYANNFGRAEWGVDKPRAKHAKALQEAKRLNAKAARAGTRLKVFANSMADFFEEKSELTPWREEAWQVIKECKNLDWLLLTKRANAISYMLPVDFWEGGYKHVHLGVTVESNKVYSRVDLLRAIPDWGGLRWLSCEPLVGDISDINLAKVDWVIVGGEKTNRLKDFRKMELSWAVKLLKKCKDEQVAYFFKQTGGIIARKDNKYEIEGWGLRREFPKF